MKKQNLSLYISLFILTSCATAEFSRKGYSNPSFLNGSTATDSVEVITKDLSRGYKPSDYSEVTATVITQPLLEARLQEFLPKSVTNEKILRKEHANEVVSRTKSRTCFEFKGKEERSVYFSKTIAFTPENWNGYVLEDGGNKISPLYFSTFMPDACTESPIDLSKPFAIVVKTQFSSVFGGDVGLMSWSPSKDNSFQFSQESGLVATSTSPSALLTALRKKMPITKSINLLSTDPNHSKMKVLLAAIGTNKIKYFKEELPLNAPYTWDDRRTLSVLATTLAQEGRKNCALDFINHMRAVGVADLEAIYLSHKANGRTYRNSFECGPFAEHMYIQAPSLRADIATAVNNAVVEYTKYPSLITNREVPAFSSLLNTFNIIYTDTKQKCAEGQKDQCIHKDLFEENMKSFKQLEAHLMKKAYSDQFYRELLKRIEEIRKQKEKQKKDTYI